MATIEPLDVKEANPSAAKATSQRYAYLSGRVVKLEEAKVSVMTHAFNYGTGVFEGIRGYHTREKDQLYVFRLREHYERMEINSKVLKIKLPFSVDDLCRLTVKIIQMNQYREDIYIRPIAFKSAERIGIKLGDEDDFTLFVIPFGAYIDITRGLSVGVSSWRRIEDNAIPPRAKICGAYVNSALAAAEARDNGFDEAIILNENGQVAEGSVMNVFLVKRGRLVTTPVTDNILEGITWNSVITLAKNELGIKTDIRSIDRTELYSASEIFLCGTGAQVVPVGSVDHRQISTGGVGPITRKIQELYDDVTHGRLERYMSWLTPMY